LQIISELDTSTASVGDQIIWNVRLNNIDKNLSLDFPKLESKNDTISIISQSNILDDNLIIGQSFKLSFWETGNFVTPSYYVRVVNEINKDEFNFEPERPSVNVISILKENSFTDPRPLKGPIPVDRLFPLILVIKIILILLLISLITFIWTKRRLVPSKMINIKNQTLPYDLAKNRLLHLDTNGFSKEFYVELSHITRQFVEKTCYIRTLEMTTEEINQNENIFEMNDDIFSEWISLLQKADLIKFAKKSTLKFDMESDKNTALKIINEAFN